MDDGMQNRSGGGAGEAGRALLEGQEEKRREEERGKRLEKGALILLGAAALVGLVYLGNLFWEARKTLFSYQAAGKFIGETIHPAIFGNRTTVQTTNGTFLVAGTFSVQPGHYAEIRIYDNGERRLCDVPSGECRKIIE